MTMVTDIHTHILPGMDDGSPDPGESLRMLREEAAQGVRKVVLTPHFYAWQNSPEEFLSRRHASWERLAPCLEPGLPEILLGAEVQYFEGISRVPEIGRLCIGDRSLLLLEMPFSRWSQRTVEEMLQLNDSGAFQVILAHADRYFSVEPRSVWERLAECGVLMQLNAEAFLHFRTKSLAKELLKKGMIQFLGSDCHNMDTRPPNLASIAPVLAKYGDMLLEL